jgi:hypothetical protein
MELPSRAAIIAALQHPQPAIAASRWEDGEQIPWMSWSAELVWASRDVDPALLLAQQPALRQLLTAQLIELDQPRILAPHGQLPDQLRWGAEELALDQLRSPDQRIGQLLASSPLSSDPVRRWWRVATVYGRYDEDTTTCTDHYLLLHEHHISYATCYEETLH